MVFSLPLVLDSLFLAPLGGKIPFKPCLIPRSGIISLNAIPAMKYAPHYFMAGRQGFEPRLADPESAVLPLDDLPMTRYARNDKIPMTNFK